MKQVCLCLAFMSILLSPSVSGNNIEDNVNNVQSTGRGIDLGEYAFGIPAEQLNFKKGTTFTLSFWVNIKEINHGENGTNFVRINNLKDPWPASNFGWMWSMIGWDGETDCFATIRDVEASSTAAPEKLNEFECDTLKWVHFSFVFGYEYGYEMRRKLVVYANGIPILESAAIRMEMDWSSEYIITIGGYSFKCAPLNAYVDKVQLYGKALSEAEVKESMSAPLLDDEKLLGYWDFEDGCTVDEDGFMTADNGSVKATMYEIIKGNGDVASGTEIRSFTFGEGVDVSSELGIEVSTATEHNTKAYVANGVLNVENSDGINMVEVYDTTGRLLVSTNGSCETGVQISLPTNVNGVLIVKVNSEVLKVKTE